MQTNPSTDAQPVWRRVLFSFKACLVPSAVMAGLWLVLGSLRAAGIQWAFLWPLNFLTGALSGTEGSALGGALGKAILLVFVNSLWRGVLLRRHWNERRRDALGRELKAQSLSKLLGSIPQYTNLRLLWSDRTPARAAAGLWGIAAALAVYPFLTGDGRFVNCMVCVVLFAGIGGQIARQRGLLITLLNLFLARHARRGIDRGTVERLFAGFALGMALSLPVAGLYGRTGGIPWLLAVRALPVLLAAVGLYCLLRPRLTQHKEVPNR